MTQDSFSNSPSLSEDWLDACGATAARIDTGVGDNATERALVVFAVSLSSSGAIAGWVTFQVEMPWRVGRVLPPIRVTHLLSGSVCAAKTTQPHYTPPSDESERGMIRFEVSWIAHPIIPGGWDTYIASYLPSATEQRAAQSEAVPTIDPDRYFIAETLRHGGDLPAQYPPALID